MDALKSLTSLTENLPVWSDKLEILSRQVCERHTEFTRISRSSFGSINRKRTGSTESLRPKDREDDNGPSPSEALEPPVVTAPVRVDIIPDQKGIFQEYRDQARRKRKSTSVLSGASGPHRFRSRMSLIVYYDSAIQEGFEWLVRNISGARNNLRKGKTAASFKARMTSMKMEESPFVGNSTQMSIRNPNLPLFNVTNKSYEIGTPSLEAFDQADQELETAQSLCEVGAHQFLREGNCAEELSGTKERFDTLLKLAQAEATKFQAQEDEERKENEAMLQFSSDQILVDDVIKADGRETDVAAAGEPDLTVDPNLSAFRVDGIEIDENDDSGSIHIDLNAFKKARKAYR